MDFKDQLEAWFKFRIFKNQNTDWQFSSETVSFSVSDGDWGRMYAHTCEPIRRST